jgi:hypothetical protein
MKPQAGNGRFDTRQEGEVVVLVDRASRQEIQLDPVAGAVWLRADGTLDVQQLAAVVSRDLDALVGEPEVWAALDALGDARLLEGRTAPPADSSLSRRFLLGSAAAVGTLLVGGAGTALASNDKSKSAPGRDNDDLGRWRSAAEQAQKGEQSAKAQESQAKTSYESSAKGEQGAKGAEDTAKTTAESSQKTSLDTFGQLRAAEEESNKLGAQLSALQAREQENKAAIAAEERAKGDISAAEQRQKSAAEQDQKQSTQLQEQKVKASAEQDQKQSAQLQEQKIKASAEQSAKSTQQ